MKKVKLIILFLLSLNVYGKDVIKEKLEDSKYLFENKNLVIDQFFDVELNNILAKKKNSKKHLIKINDKDYFGVAQFSTKCTEIKFLIVSVKCAIREYFLINSEVGFSTQDFVSVAKFSDNINVIDPDYGVVFDSLGNHCIYNPFFGGFINNYTSCTLHGINNPISTRIKLINSDQHQDSSSHSNMFNFVSLFPESFNYESLLKNGFIPLSFFLGQEVKSTLGFEVNDSLNVFYLNSIDGKKNTLKVYVLVKIMNENRTSEILKLFSLALNKQNGVLIDKTQLALFKRDIQGITYSSVPIEELNRIIISEL